MSHSPTTWLVIEPMLTGHHFPYLEHIVGGAVERGIRVVVGVGTDRAGDEIERGLRTAFPSADIAFVRIALPHSSVSGPALLAVGMLRWRRFMAEIWSAACTSWRIDLVFVPYLDCALFAIALLGSPFGACPFGGITMRQRFHFPAMGVAGTQQGGAAWRRWLFFRFLRFPTLQRVMVIDETLREFVKRIDPRLVCKVLFMPDPSDPPRPMPRTAAREILGLPAGVLVVLLYGYIEARKGVAVLLDWAAGDRAVHLVLAGRVDRDVKGFVSGDAALRLRAAGRLIVLDRYITDEEEQTLFSATDWVWLAYDSFELMSGVLVKGVQHGRGVLFRDVGLIGHFARRYGSGAIGKPPEGSQVLRFPAGVMLSTFSGGSTAGTPPADHSWGNACRIIFGPVAG